MDILEQWRKDLPAVLAGNDPQGPSEMEQARKRGDVKPVGCEMKGCSGMHVAHGVCATHYARFRHAFVTGPNA